MLFASWVYAWLAHLAGAPVWVPAALLCVATLAPQVLGVPGELQLQREALTLATAAGACWVLLLWHPRQLSIAVSAMGWGALLWLEPALLPLSLLALPRMALLAGERARTFYLFAWLSLLLSIIAGCWFYQWYETWLHFRDGERWLAIGTDFLERLSQSGLLFLVPLLGVMDLTQREAEELKFCFRNVMLWGAFLCLPLLEEGWVTFWSAALPLSMVLLTRWVLAVPGRLLRVAASLGLTLSLLWQHGGLQP